MHLSRCVGRRRSAWTAASTLANVTASADMRGLPALGVSKTRKRGMVAPSALAARLQQPSQPLWLGAITTC